MELILEVHAEKSHQVVSTIPIDRSISQPATTYTSHLYLPGARGDGEGGAAAHRGRRQYVMHGVVHCAMHDMVHGVAPQCGTQCGAWFNARCNSRAYRKRRHGALRGASRARRGGGRAVRRGTRAQPGGG